MIINKPYTMPLAELPYSIKIIELPGQTDKLPFQVESKRMLHTSFTLGFRTKLEDKVVTYCPDTGYCENAVKLSRNADLLIAECAYKSGQRKDKWPHLNPEDAAKLAAESNAKKLALIHFDAHIYQTFSLLPLTLQPFVFFVLFVVSSYFSLLPLTLQLFVFFVLFVVSSYFSLLPLTLQPFVPFVYFVVSSSLEDREITEEQAKKIFNNTFAAIDDMQIEV